MADLLTLYGVGRTTLWTWERESIIPPGFFVGPGTKRWLDEDIEDDLERKKEEQNVTRSKAKI
jgi:predicted DNA-binding transcriptional regulator AlpA